MRQTLGAKAYYRCFQKLYFNSYLYNIEHIEHKAFQKKKQEKLRLMLTISLNNNYNLARYWVIISEL